MFGLENGSEKNEECRMKGKRKTQAGVRIKCINQKTNYSEVARFLCLSYFDA
jgi:hypothetical protein